MKRFSLVIVLALSLFLSACNLTDTTNEQTSTTTQTTTQTTTTSSETTTTSTFTTSNTTETSTDAIQTQMSVSSKTELEVALANVNVQVITLLDNISGDITVNRAVELDLGGYTLDGDISFLSDGGGKTKLKPGKIMGDIDVLTPNMSFDNHAEVDGYINIREISSDSYFEYGLFNDIRVYADNSRIVIMSSTNNLGILASNVNIELEFTVETLGVENGYTDITVTNARLITEAILYSDDVLFDSLPYEVSGDIYLIILYQL